MEVLEIVAIKPILLVTWYVRLSRGSVDLGSDLVSGGTLKSLADWGPGLVQHMHGGGPLNFWGDGTGSNFFGPRPSF